MDVHRQQHHWHTQTLSQVSPEPLQSIHMLDRKIMELSLLETMARGLRMVSMNGDGCCPNPLLEKWLLLCDPIRFVPPTFGRNVWLDSTVRHTPPEGATSAAAREKGTIPSLRHSLSMVVVEERSVIVAAPVSLSSLLLSVGGCSSSCSGCLVMKDEDRSSSSKTVRVLLDDTVGGGARVWRVWDEEGMDSVVRARGWFRVIRGSGGGTKEGSTTEGVVEAMEVVRRNAPLAGGGVVLVPTTGQFAVSFLALFVDGGGGPATGSAGIVLVVVLAPRTGQVSVSFLVLFED